MKRQYVKNIKINDQINDVFVLVDKQIGHTRDGKIFANMTFEDKTGQIKAVMWDNVDSMAGSISIGDFVLVKASVGEYRSIIQLVLKHITPVFDESKIHPTDFLSITKKNIDSMFDRLISITNTISNTYIKLFFKLLWEDSCFVKQFKHAPAAKHLHHAYIGGLLEHTLSMLMIGEKIAKHYDGVDRDLLLTGIVIHDIGKIKELNYRTKIDYTDEGRLLSHIIIGITIIDEKIKKIPSFPLKTELLLKHLIVSHHGAKEFGSPEPPKTMEAILLNCIDDMDFRINSIRDYIDNDINSGCWTSYNRILERHFYKGNTNK